jgi:hypothetical protein
MVFENRWVEQEDGSWFATDKSQRRGAIVAEYEGELYLVVRRLLSDRYVDMRSYDGEQAPGTIDEAKELADEYIAQLNEIGE